MNTQTIWKPLYEGKYSISTDGEVISHKKSGDKILYQYKHKNGDCEVSLCVNGKPKRYMVHKLMGETFIPNPNNFKNVIHIDGRNDNNIVSNLMWSKGMDNH